MPKSSPRFRFAVAAVLVVVAGAGLALARWAALPWALGAALRAGGATEVSFAVTRVSPWRLQVEDVAFKLPVARVAAETVSLERKHWWTPSLGRVRVQSARVDVDVARLASANGETKPADPKAEPGRLPLEEFSVDGVVTLQTGTEPAQALTVGFVARPDRDNQWTGEAKVGAPGLELAVEGRYAPATAAAEFRTTALRLEVKSWQAWLEQWVPLPAGPWEIGGVVTGEMKGGYRNGQFAGEGDFQLRDGRVANAETGVVLDGVELDVKAVDFAQMRAQGIAARAKNVTVGKIAMADLQAVFANATAERVEVSSLSVRALGGTLRVEPFAHAFADPGIEAVVLAQAIRAEEVLALTEDLPARATGPLSGRLPLRWEAGTLRLGTGWLGLAADHTLELQLQAEGLLTGGASPKSTNYAILKQVENGLLKLNVTKLRLDVRPPNVPENRSAQLHIEGAPVDPLVKAPVTLDLNVNGPIESLINLGLKTRMGAGTRP